MKEFQAAFQISKTIVFEVKYYTLLDNKNPHFTTSASQFCRSKRDYTICGQAQETLLKPGTAARAFFDIWDPKHLQPLTTAEYDEMRNDIETLKGKYNYIFEELDESRRPYNPSIGFYRLAEFTKQMPKKNTKKTKEDAE